MDGGSFKHMLRYLVVEIQNWVIETLTYKSPVNKCDPIGKRELIIAALNYHVFFPRSFRLLLNAFRQGQASSPNAGTGRHHLQTRVKSGTESKVCDSWPYGNADDCHRVRGTGQAGRVATPCPSLPARVLINPGRGQASPPNASNTRSGIQTPKFAIGGRTGMVMTGTVVAFAADRGTGQGLSATGPGRSAGRCRARTGTRQMIVLSPCLATPLFWL